MKEYERDAERLLNPTQPFERDLGIYPVHEIGGDRRQLRFDPFDMVVRVPFVEPFTAEKLTVKGGEEPGLDLLGIP